MTKDLPSAHCKLLLYQALVDEGKIKYIGLSEVGPDDLRKAHSVHPITAVQLEWSLWTRDVEVSLRYLLRNCPLQVLPGIYGPLQVSHCYCSAERDKDACMVSLSCLWGLCPATRCKLDDHSKV